MKLLKPRFTIGSLLILSLLCAFAAQRFTSSYRQQVLLAQEIEELGGEVFHGWHNPIVEDAVFPVTFMRSEVSSDGRNVMIPDTRRIPYRRVRTSPPKEAPSWTIFDWSTNWNIRYVALPHNQFSPENIALLKTIPSLRYIELKMSGNAYDSSLEIEEVELKKLRDLFPTVEVIDRDEHLNQAP